MQPLHVVTIAKHRFVAISKIVPHEYIDLTQTQHYTSNGKVRIRHISHTLDDSVITHDCYLKCTTWRQAEDALSEPDTKCGIMVWMGAAKAIQRPSNSRAIIVDDTVYYILTWTDVLKKKHNKQCDLRRVTNGQMVIFLRQAPDASTKMILQALESTGHWRRTMQIFDQSKNAV